jgi:hypothetical protein
VSNALAVHSLSTLDTDIVVDLGCCSYQHGQFVEDSIQTLIKRFSPTVLFGFDPHPGLPDAVGQVYGTTVVTSRRAAWTHNGEVGLSLQGDCTHVDLDEEQRAKAFDLAAWIRTLPEARIVLKVDIEGAEYVLLPHLIDQDVMSRFSHVLIEWHEGKLANGFESDRASILAGIQCPVEEWQ